MDKITRLDRIVYLQKMVQEIEVVRAESMVLGARVDVDAEDAHSINLQKR